MDTPIPDLLVMDDIDLLTVLVILEAEAEPLLGKIAVACVVRNRVHDKRWPDRWKEVMLQPKQFSCFLPEYFRPEVLTRSHQDPYWRESHFAAFGVYNKYIRAEANHANHYYSTDIQEPYWAKGHEPVLEIGKHRFYKL